MERTTQEEAVKTCGCMIPCSCAYHDSFTNVTFRHVSGQLLELPDIRLSDVAVQSIEAREPSQDSSASEESQSSLQKSKSKAPTGAALTELERWRPGSVTTFGEAEPPTLATIFIDGKEYWDTAIFEDRVRGYMMEIAGAPNQPPYEPLQLRYNDRAERFVQNVAAVFPSYKNRILPRIMRVWKAWKDCYEQGQFGNSQALWYRVYYALEGHPALLEEFRAFFVLIDLDTRYWSVDKGNDLREQWKKLFGGGQGVAQGNL